VSLSLKENLRGKRPDAMVCDSPRARTSLSLMIALDGPLDQYLAGHPEVCYHSGSL
jgi:hypothetical protein